MDDMEDMDRPSNGFEIPEEEEPDFGNRFDTRFTSISDLSPDTKFLILEYLTFREIRKFWAVNSEFRFLASSNRLLKGVFELQHIDEVSEVVIRNNCNHEDFSAILKDRYLSFRLKLQYITSTGLLSKSRKGELFVYILTCGLLTHVLVLMFFVTPILNSAKDSFFGNNRSFIREEKLSNRSFISFTVCFLFIPFVFFFYVLVCINYLHALKRMDYFEDLLKLNPIRKPEDYEKNRTINRIRFLFSIQNEVKSTMFYNLLLTFSFMFHGLTTTFLSSIFITVILFPTFSWKIGMTIPTICLVIFFYVLVWIILPILQGKCDRTKFELDYSRTIVSSILFTQFSIFYVFTGFMIGLVLDGNIDPASSNIGVKCFNLFGSSFVLMISCIVLVQLASKYLQKKSLYRPGYYSSYKLYRAQNLCQNITIFLVMFYVIMMILCLSFVFFIITSGFQRSVEIDEYMIAKKIV